MIEWTIALTAWALAVGLVLALMITVFSIARIIEIHRKRRQDTRDMIKNMDEAIERIENKIDRLSEYTGFEQLR